MVEFGGETERERETALPEDRWSETSLLVKSKANFLNPTPNE